MCGDEFLRMAYKVNSKNISKCRFCNSSGFNKRNDVPAEFLEILKHNKTVTFDVFEKFSGCNSKKNVVFLCAQCNTECIMMWNKLKQRSDKFQENGKMKLCNNCYKKHVSKHETHRKNNSEAQKIAQNKPETIAKHRKTQITRYNNDPSLRIKMSLAVKKMLAENPQVIDKIRKNSISNWLKPEYVEKQAIRKNQSTLAGKYDGVFFASSYELSFILYCKKNNITINRSNLSLRYTDDFGSQRYYIPDFIIKNNTSDKLKLVEIKGANGKNLNLKNDSARKFCENNEMDFEIKFLNNLIEDGVELIKSIKDLKLIDRSKLTVTSIPKRWKYEFFKNRRNSRI